jgi:c-di-GMP-binding flagellar brake protein YcgR
MSLSPERRLKPRIDLPFSAKVRGVDANGEAFETDSVLDNLSAGGLYLRMARSLKQGAELLVLVELPTGSANNTGPSQIEAQGVILRTEPQVSGDCGVAVAFTKHRFI